MKMGKEATLNPILTNDLKIITYSPYLVILRHNPKPRISSKYDSLHLLVPCRLSHNIAKRWKLSIFFVIGFINIFLTKKEFEGKVLSKWRWQTYNQSSRCKLIYKYINRWLYLKIRWRRPRHGNNNILNYFCLIHDK